MIVEYNTTYYIVPTIILNIRYIIVCVSSDNSVVVQQQVHVCSTTNRLIVIAAV